MLSTAGHGEGVWVWGLLPALEAQPRKFFRAASQAPLCALGIFNIPGGCGRGARCRTGCPVPDGLPSSPRLWRDGWDGIWCGFRRCGCTSPPIPSEPSAVPLTGVPRGPCATPGGSSASFTSVDLLWGEGLGLLGVGRCCGEQQNPSLAATSSPPNRTGSALPGHSAGLAAKASPISCLAPAPGNDLGCLSCTAGCLGPPGPGEEAASLGGQEEAAVAADTQRRPGSPPRKESAAGAGDPQGAAGTGRPSLCGLAAAAMPVTVTVTLPGPAPWGFRISGGRDFGKPITVSKVTEHGKAATGDLRPGDVIVTINGESTAEMLNVEAQNKIRQSPGQLRLDVERSPVPSPSHTNGDTSPEMLASRFQDTLQVPSESRSALRTLDPGLASLTHPPGSASSQPLEQEFTCPGLPQVRRLSRQSSSQGAVLPPPPRPPSPELGAPQNPWATPRERRLSSPCPSTWPSQGSEPAMRRLEEDSEVYKMLQQNRELRAAPRQSSTFRLLQEALEDEEGGGPAAPFPSRLSAGARKPVAGVQKLHVCEKCGSSIATQAVRIQDGRYRHPSCYTCADCGLSLKMRGHFWVGDELFCEKHARLRYQGPPGGPVPRPVSPRS
ncbi:PDZ and LIM domain protein 2 isoform X1 [Onychostruthus taczanowskii]|uniref:PDZ and LIM domain protein 2 isoform X1 n=2 Tax=Onychostruthus taczanowskii TaxID=356909 RepID=UPI001B80AD59|nr:PDZ and LIM domain protein 2 isoform X1 [Onychostruthus taczanowskii]